MAVDNNDFTHEFQIYNTDLNAGTMGTGEFMLFDNNINALIIKDISNIQILGGENGQVMVADGEGNLNWASISGGGGIQVNADWNSNSGASRILNKPDLSTYLPLSGGTLTGKLNAAQGSGTSGGYSFGGTEGGADTGMFSNADGILDFYANNVKIVTVTTSGVTSTQSITLPGNPTQNLQASTKQYVDSSINALNNFSGNYDDLTNKPTIPTSVYIGTTRVLFNRASGSLTLTGVSIDGNAATVSNGVYTTGSYADPDWITSLAYSKLIGAPTLATVATTGAYSSLTGKPNLATVATSGSYTDLVDKPSIFSGSYSDLTGKPTLFNGAYADLIGKPNLATVATSGSYDDLSNKPTIPSAYTLPKSSITTLGGVKIDGTTIIIDGNGVISAVSGDLFSGSYNDLTNKPDLSLYLPLSGGTLTGKLNAAQGSGTTGGYSFGGTEGGNDTGMFSNADGILDFYSNNTKIVTVNTDSLTSTVPVILPTDPINNLEAATKQYVDNAVNSVGGTFSGDYNDLSNLPTLFDGQYSSLNGTPSLSTVATSGDYNDLANTPTIPSDVSDLTDNSNLLGPFSEIVNTDGTNTYSFSIDTDGVLTTPGSIIPSTDDTVDLGSPTNKFRHLYVGAGTIYIGNIKLTNTNGKLEAKKVTNPGKNNEQEDQQDSDAFSPLRGITLSSLSMGVNNSPNGSGAVSYNNSTGVFRYTPPDLSSYVTGTPWADEGYLTSNDLSGYATELYVDNKIEDLINLAPDALNTLGELATQLANDESAVSALTTSVSGKVSLTGSYSDPTWITSLAYSKLTGAPELATVATTGSYNDLINKPSLFSGSYTDLTNKPSLFSGSYTDLTNKPSLFSGSYTDLTNKPTIPSHLTDLSITDGTNGQVLTTNGSGTFTFATPTVNTANITGTTLPSNITGSSLTSVGTLNSLTVSGNVTATQYFGDGSQLSGISVPSLGVFNHGIISGSTMTVDFTKGQIQFAEISGGNVTVTLINPGAGRYVFLMIKNTSGNSRSVTSGISNGANASTGNVSFNINNQRSGLLQYFSIDNTVANVRVAYT